MPPKKTQKDGKTEKGEKPKAEEAKPKELNREQLEALRRKLQSKFH